jgi:hypothetical protein
LYSGLCDGVCSNQSSKDLRALLNERIFGSLQNAGLHLKIENLRLQKRLLLSGKTRKTADARIDIRSLIVLGMAVGRMRKAVAALALE